MSEQNLIKKLLIKERMQRSLNWITPSVTSLLTSSPDLVLAGGGIASKLNITKSGDYDLFYLGDKSLSEFVKTIRHIGILNQMSLKFNGFHHDVCTFSHDKSFKDAPKIQIIKKENCHTLESVLESFDLVPCMIGMRWNIKEGELEVFADRRTLKAIARKSIEFNKVVYPLVAMKRFLKYHDKGYSCDDVQMRTFLEQIHTRLLTYNLSEDISKDEMWASYSKV